MFAAILGLSKIAATPAMSLLYSGLESSAAGDVVQALEQNAVKYDIRNGAIYVESSRRDELRMTMAADGLPATAGQGYELLDTLSGFGTTAQMFDATYWRAKEGELARTIVASPKISSARVHISNASTRSFRKPSNATASVTVTGSAGTFPVAHAKALRYLVASAVAGLDPKDVSIIDGRNGIIVTSEENPALSANGQDKAAEIKKNVERLLAAHVGAGAAIVEVSVETVTEQESILEHRFDPDSRVVISSDTEERSTNSNDSGSGSVTVASNLPEGDGAGGGSSSSSENSETRERLNFEVAETTREIIRKPGAIKRLSIAVLIDGTTQVDPATGEEVWSARTDEELASLNELVSSAVGFSAERGDVITLKSLEFQPVAEIGTVASASMIQRLNLDIMKIVQMGMLAIVSLVVGLFVLRPMFLRAPEQERDLLPPALAPDVAATTARLTPDRATPITAELPGPALSGEIQDEPVPNGLALAGNSQMQMINANRPSNAAQVSGEISQDAAPVDRLRGLIADRQDETVEVLRSWMEDKEEHV